MPIHQIERETRPKESDVSFSNIVEVTRIFDDLLKVVDEPFLIKFKAHGLYEHYMRRTPNIEPDNFQSGFFSISQVPQVNLIQTCNFEAVLIDLLKYQNPSN